MEGEWVGVDVFQWNFSVVTTVGNLSEKVWVSNGESLGVVQQQTHSLKCVLLKFFSGEHEVLERGGVGCRSEHPDKFAGGMVEVETDGQCAGPGRDTRRPEVLDLTDHIFMGPAGEVVTLGILEEHVLNQQKHIGDLPTSLVGNDVWVSTAAFDDEVGFLAECKLNADVVLIESDQWKGLCVFVTEPKLDGHVDFLGFFGPVEKIGGSFATTCESAKAAFLVLGEFFPDMHVLTLLGVIDNTTDIQTALVNEGSANIVGESSITGDVWVGTITGKRAEIEDEVHIGNHVTGTDDVNLSFSCSVVGGSASERQLLRLHCEPSVFGILCFPEGEFSIDGNVDVLYTLSTKLN